jgi:hypothetical protein
MCLLKKIFKKQSVRFICTGDECKIFGYPELEGRSGLMIGDGMAFFRPRHLELYIANTKTGKIRKISKGYEKRTISKCDGEIEKISLIEIFERANNLLLVNDTEIDYKAIYEEFARDKNALSNARDKAIRHKEIGTCYGFNKGYCAIYWELEPCSAYYGNIYGGDFSTKDAKEVYAIMNTDLEIVEPFRPVKDLNKYLEEIETKYGSQ